MSGLSDFIERAKVQIEDARFVLVSDIPHSEIKDLMLFTNTKELLLNINPTYDEDFKGKPIRRSVMFITGWFFFRFMKYKIWRYKTKYPEYLL